MSVVGVGGVLRGGVLCVIVYVRSFVRCVVCAQEISLNYRTLPEIIASNTEYFGMPSMVLFVAGGGGAHVLCPCVLCTGATIGRYANRISRGVFELDGQVCCVQVAAGCCMRAQERYDAHRMPFLFVDVQTRHKRRATSLPRWGCRI